jgi:hypothetical protein
VNNQLLLLFSHDTNILYLQRLLNLNWVPLGFGNNIATTGGTLNFELYQNNENGEINYFVKVRCACVLFVDALVTVLCVFV